MKEKILTHELLVIAMVTTGSAQKWGTKEYISGVWTPTPMNIVRRVLKIEFSSSKALEIGAGGIPLNILVPGASQKIGGGPNFNRIKVKMTKAGE